MSCALACSSATWAKQGALDAWERQYGTLAAVPVSDSANNVPSKCALCHYDWRDLSVPDQIEPKLNAYGAAIRAEFFKVSTYPTLSDNERDKAILAVELYNADNDIASPNHLDPVGTTNIGEILKHAQPGWSPGSVNTIYRGHWEYPLEPIGGGPQGPLSGIKGSLDPIAGPLRRATAVAIGGAHGCAIVDKGVLCWGSNSSGQLADGTKTSRPTAAYAFDSNDSVAIAAGGSHTCVLTTALTAKCWGAGGDGQLGTGEFSVGDRTKPVILQSNVSAIALGDRHTCILMTGKVACTGYNASGQLGIPPPELGYPAEFSLVLVSGLPSISAIAAGGDTTCALSTAGAVWCWGDLMGRSTPTLLNGLTSGVAAIALGRRHLCVRTTGNAARCLGNNESGQLGNGNNTFQPTPVGVVGLSSGVVALSLGGNHSCARTSANAVKCWGLNNSGQLGNGTTASSNVPVDGSGLSSAVTWLSAGAANTCAITTNDAVNCWGTNSSGQLGNGSSVRRSTATPVVANLAAGLATGVTHSCSLMTGGRVRCWGNNSQNQLGDNTTSQRTKSTSVVALNAPAIAVGAGQAFTCALTANGGVKCWGYNGAGQIGDGTGVQQPLPVDVSGLASGVVSLAVGFEHACALTLAGGVKCWGSNWTGQLGDGTQADRLQPVDVVGLPGGVLALAAGHYHTCAVDAAGGVKCWGLNNSGQLGDNTQTFRTAPVSVVGLASGVTAIGAGGAHTCALNVAGGVKCWGSNLRGQLGDGTNTTRLAPVSVTALASGVAAVALGDRHSCALMADGVVKCWGNNALGQLGDGTIGDHNVPATMVGVPRAASISAGYRHTCLLVTPGAVRCVGDNGFGQLGNGTTSFSELVAVFVEKTDTQTSLVASVNPSTGGRNVTFTASITGLDPTGGVSFAANGSLVTGCVSIPVVNGHAACTTNALAPGTYAIVARYSGDDTFASGQSDALAHTVVAPAVPGAPTAGTAVAGNGQATVSFLPPANDGGSPITGYTVTSNPAGGIDSSAATTSQSHVVTGLANGTPYTFTVSATNAIGTGPASAPSNAVTPQGYTLTLTAVNGSIAANPTRPSYPANAEVRLTATPNANYLFSHWSGDASGTTNPYTLTMTVNRSVTAHFVAKATCTYTLAPTDVHDFAKAGGSAHIVVTTPNGCPVTATSFQPWVTVGAITHSGTGTTSVQLAIAANTGPARATTIVLAGRLFLIHQRGQ
jgi:alpha-tubulin suppressor-like RCC1 family protein